MGRSWLSSFGQCKESEWLGSDPVARIPEDARSQCNGLGSSKSGIGNAHILVLGCLSRQHRQNGNQWQLRRIHWWLLGSGRYKQVQHELEWWQSRDSDRYSLELGSLHCSEWRPNVPIVRRYGLDNEQILFKFQPIHSQSEFYWLESWRRCVH